MDPSSCLHLEVLLKVFHHYLTDREIPVQSFNFSDGLWVLGQVSSAWRAAVLSDKSLWSTINVAVNYPPHVDTMTTVDGGPISFMLYEEEPLYGIHTKILSPTTNEILSYILRRSGDLPLDISLHFPAKFLEAEDVISSTWRPFFSILSAESRRWRSLNLVAPAPIWEDFSAIPEPGLPLLKTVHAILPRGLCLMPFVNRCEKVVDLSIGIRRADGTPMNQNPVEMKKLHQLQVLAPLFLGAITAPNVKSLVVMNKAFAEFRFPTSFIPDFIRRSGCALTELVLHWNDTTEELFRILSSVPTLESLSCHGRLDVAFYEGMKSPSPLLPNLRALNLQRQVDVHRRFQFVTKPTTIVDATPVIDMVESRLASEVLQSVSISDVVVNVFRDAAKARLARLNEIPGVKVDIRQFDAGVTSGFGFNIATVY
ncbi:uncharacterized protein EV420DRAFT_1180935 [Desarmillaria tabescens]|uniref:F-box domain-containing protein n=1 Tax=Armillaria tabescens TaxID=1929756 RepID=A0AA39TKH9_ARMTA|nr:uncharacterized protein EV420DRAFT_1180935 [Desarmillaria tabescens]KAK0462297.1 hypothetical protein EV420DRAFT_1180935 [Desarmillaria tabescens]